ncbi:bacteriohemerythrin [Pseudomonadota bacterium]
MSDKELEWSDKFSTDIVSIDRQHQELLYLSQNLLEVLSSDTSTLEDKQAAFGDLVDHAVAHFDYEERMMFNISYPDREAHMKEHAELKNEVANMAETVMRGEGVEDWKGLASLVQVWVLRHIVASDTKFREYIQRDYGMEFDLE